MKKVTIKISNPSEDIVTGYIFKIYGVDMVVHRNPQYPFLWTVTEYRTGMKVIPTSRQRYNRKDVIASAIEFVQGFNKDTVIKTMNIQPTLNG